MNSEERKKQLLDIGARLGAKIGIVNVQRQAVAVAAKCADSLVSSYLGTNEVARKAYRKHMKKLGLVEPSKDKIAAAGIKLRSHAPNDVRDVRKRSVKEVEAIKRKPGKTTAAKAALVSAKKSAASSTPAKKSLGVAATAKPVPSPTKPRKSPAKPRSAPERKPTGPTEHKSAARKPMAPPTRPVDPVAIEPVLSGSFP